MKYEESLQIRAFHAIFKYFGKPLSCYLLFFLRISFCYSLKSRNYVLLAMSESILSPVIGVLCYAGIVRRRFISVPGVQKVKRLRNSTKAQVSWKVCSILSRFLSHVGIVGGDEGLLYRLESLIYGCSGSNCIPVAIDRDVLLSSEFISSIVVGCPTEALTYLLFCCFSSILRMHLVLPLGDSVLNQLVYRWLACNEWCLLCFCASTENNLV